MVNANVTLKVTTTALGIALSITVFMGLWPRPAESANVLAIETIAGKSHWNFMSSILRTLTDNGHRVTAFTPFPDGDRENYTEIDTSGNLPKKHDVRLEDMIETMGDPIRLLWVWPAICRSYCDIIYSDSRLRAMLDGGEPTEFDLLLIEPIWSDCMSYVAVRLNLPVIYLVPQPMVTFVERKALGHVPNPASVSSLLARHAVPVTFAQRLVNSAQLVYAAIIFGVYESLIGYVDPKPYDYVRPVTPSVLFVNSHHVTEPARPTSPNVVPVAGIHLKPARPTALPNDILEFIEDSPHGVIYFTFGSVVLMSTLPDHVQNAFREALAQVPQRVLWKYEGEMKDKPKNVMTSKWFPQRDILMHPKVKLFISHGGISGVYEAVDAGVPVLGFPLYYDQPRNIENLVEAGMAISMDLSTVKTDLFLKNILEIINNENYTKNAKIASDIFKDRPMTPAQSVVYWTEYVIRHKGAPHLKSQALNLTWYQYFLLDVIAVVLIVIFLVFSIIITIFKFIYKFFSLNKKEIKTKSE